MSVCITALLTECIRRNHIAGRRIVLMDDETKERNIYEDLDQETVTSERMSLVTLEPMFSRAMSDATGDEDGFQITLSHAKAIADIRKMLSLGWRLVSIERDLGERSE